MNKKSKLIFAIIFLIILAAGYYFLFRNEDKAGNSVADNTFGWQYPSVKFPITGPGEIAYSDIRDPGGIPEGLPVRLKIPTIGVNSAIEDALITPDGRMDVPAGSTNVAWFALGPHPGHTGSAVIGGHFGIRNGVKFVFYDLDKLKVGDKVYVEDDKGDTLVFQVRSIKLFNRNDDATTVFTSNDGLAHLNLITCEGIWNRVNGAYPLRRVVFTDAISGEVTPFVPISSDKGITKIEDVATFYRTFGMGAKGADVAALQTFLQEKKFLIMPTGVAKGFFGPLTRSAVAKYQISAGLSPAGVFGPQTRAKVLAELGGDTGLPNAGIEKITNQISVIKSSAFSKSFLSSIKSIYSTPKDALITTVLLFSIIFVLFKIIKKKNPPIIS